MKVHKVGTYLKRKNVTVHFILIVLCTVTEKKYQFLLTWPV